MHNYCHVSVSFPAQKSKIELRIDMQICNKLKATYLIALVHISNENTEYLFEVQDGGQVLRTVSKFKAVFSRFAFENVRNRTKTDLVTLICLIARALNKIITL